MATASAIASLTDNRMYQTDRVEESDFMNGLSRESVEAIGRASTRMTFKASELVYAEGETATGAYIILRGKVKLVANSSDGKALILRIAGPGSIISLSAALSERANDTSAEAVDALSVSYIQSAALYRLMEKSGDLALHMAHELSVEYSSLCQELSALGLQRSAMSRLAKLLVGMTKKAEFQGGTIASACPLTHEEIAQMIGTSRETVTRLLHDLRDEGIAVLKNETLTISKIEKLRALTN